MAELVSPPELSREHLNTLVGTKIKDLNLYRRSFTHKSALKRYSGLTGSYETLEFMGDSVLGFVITKHLFDLHEKEQEGFLTKARTKMVRGKTLCEIATQLGLDSWILMDDKGIRNNWNTNPNILEDVFEALIGAIYLDLGMVHAKKFVFSAFDRVEVTLHERRAGRVLVGGANLERTRFNGFLQTQLVTAHRPPGEPEEREARDHAPQRLDQLRRRRRRPFRRRRRTPSLLEFLFCPSHLRGKQKEKGKEERAGSERKEEGGERKEKRKKRREV